MQNEPPMNDPQTIWQNQNTEEMKMSLMQLQQKAKYHRARARRMVITNDLTYIALLVFLGCTFARVPNTTSRVGLVLLAIGSFYSVYRRHKQLWPLSLTPDTPPSTGLETYRRELQRWREDSRKIWRMLAPLIPGGIIFVLPGITSLVHTWSQNPVILINALPVCILLVVWLTLMFPVRQRRLRRIQQELDMLDGLLSARRDSVA
jgi:hypothetical protein